jgi:hypothetical protein
MSPSPSPTLRPYPDPQSLTHRPQQSLRSTIPPHLFPHSPISDLALHAQAILLPQSLSLHFSLSSLKSLDLSLLYAAKQGAETIPFSFSAAATCKTLSLSLSSLKSLDLSLLYAAKQGAKTQKLSKLSSSFRWEASKDRWAESRFWALENGMGLEP